MVHNADARPDRRSEGVRYSWRGFRYGESSGALEAHCDQRECDVRQGAHSGKGLGDGELSAFKYYQEKARREYATSGIRFEVHVTEGAYLRTQGYAEIPTKFLVGKTINLFVTDTLGYDIDKDRTGGCSIGPHPPAPRYGGDRFYKTFLGLKDAGEKTLSHEYAHHFTLDTRRNPSATGNFWADLRNDYWLWRQRHGVPIPEFRACASSEWAQEEIRAAIAAGRM
jgi:hypothetical protein